MKRILYTSIAVMMAMLTSIAAFAQGSAGYNLLLIPDVEGVQGKTISVPVNMTNAEAVVAVQFDIALPFPLAIDDVTLNEQRSNGHSVSVAKLSGYNYRVAIVSLKENATLKGNSGKLLTLPVTLGTDLTPNSKHNIRVSNIVMAKADGTNIAASTTADAVITISDTQHVDLTCSDLSTSASVITPGKEIDVTWKVNNIGGIASTSGWTENIFLEDATGEHILIATTSYDGTLDSGASVERKETIEVPKVLHTDGYTLLYMEVKANGTAGEPSAYQGNNSTKSKTTKMVEKLLYGNVSSLTVAENKGTARLMLTRSGSWGRAETFNVSVSDASRISVPASVTIPQHSASAYITLTGIDNDVFNEDNTVTLTIADGNGYKGFSIPVTIVEDEHPALTMKLSKSEMTEGETTELTISMEKALTKDLIITLACDHSVRFSFPKTVTIYAGKTSATVTLAAIDDEEPSNIESVEFIATAEGFSKASVIMLLNDNDVPEIDLILTPTTVNEDAGYNAVMAKLYRTKVTNNKITVKLSDDTKGRIYYPNKTLVMEKGVTELSFTLGVIDNNTVDGDIEANINAAVYISNCSCSTIGTSSGEVTRKLTILDNDGPSLQVSLSSSTILEGKENMTKITVKRNTTTAEALTVTLTSDRDDELVYDHQVTIPMGSVEVTIPVSAKANSVEEGNRTVVFTAKAEGFNSGSAWAMITDQTLPDATVSITCDKEQVEAAGYINVTMTIENQGVAILPEMTKVNLHVNSNTYDTYYIQEDVAPGASTTIKKSVRLANAVMDNTIYAVVNEAQEKKELIFVNNTSNKVVVKTVAPYRIASLTTDKKIYKQEEKVTLSGKLEGSKTDSIKVEVFMILNGLRQNISTISDKEGNFTAEWTLPYGISGHIAAGACFPNEKNNDAKSEFDVIGLTRTTSSYITCETVVGETYNGHFEIENPSGVDLHSLKCTVESPENMKVNISNMPSTLAGGQKADINFSILAGKATTENAWQLTRLTFSTEEGATLNSTIYAIARVKTGKLTVNTDRIKTTMISGTTRDYPLQIINKGAGESGEITLALPQSGWMTTLTPRVMPSIAPGDTANVVLRFTPTDDMKLNFPITGSIGINCANGEGLSLPFSVEPVSEAEGTLVVEVCDEYTYYTEEQPRVEGATITIQHPSTGIVIASQKTDKSGICKFNIPEGYYQMIVTEDKHKSHKEYVMVDPGTSVKYIANLSIEAIKVSYRVEPTEIEDVYSIATTVEYETRVPTAVVTTDLPDEIPLENMKAGDQLLLNVTMTNHGLITARETALEIPEIQGFTVKALKEMPIDIAAQTSVIVPLLITCNVTPESPAQAKRLYASDDVKPGCHIDWGWEYFIDCGEDRRWHTYRRRVKILQCPPSKGGLGGGGGVAIWGGGIGWGGSPSGGPNSPSFPSGPSYNPIEINVPDVDADELRDCIPCTGKYVMKVTKCVVTKDWDCIYSVGDGLLDKARHDDWDPTPSSIADDVLTLIGCGAELCTSIATGAAVATEGASLAVAGVCKTVGTITTVISCIKPLFEPCDHEGEDIVNDLAKPVARVKAENGYPSYIQKHQECAKIAYDESLASQKLIDNIFGDEAWRNITNDELHDLFTEIRMHKSEGLLRFEDYKAVKPECVSMKQLETFIERMNNTLRKANGETVTSDNFVSRDSLYDSSKAICDAEQKSFEMGYTSTTEMYEKETEKMQDEANQTSKGVCATISLKLSQEMVMTRQAFRGTLTVFNGNDDTAMTDVKLNLEIRDDEGQLATEHEFQMVSETLDGFTGEFDLQSGWTLDSQKTGNATVLFIPTKYAAETVARDYTFGGTLTYIDPFTNLSVTRDLTPVTLQVKPSPNLELIYFMQRDIYGDDPLTEDKVEPIIPAEFALVIKNNGKGDATKVRMTTHEPEITKNEKGLKNTFWWSGTQVNGMDQALSFGQTIANDFGTISAGKTAYAQWWLNSDLLGHFKSYNVEATHVTSYGNEDLSLLDTVHVHELIHGFTVDEISEPVTRGFLVNDIVDANDTPDILYFSDGRESIGVSTATASITQNNDNEYAVTVNGDATGWVYGMIDDPTLGRQKMRSIRRQSDNAIIPTDNFWLTDRTLRDGKDPLYENKLHFVAKVNGNETFIVSFDPKPEVELDIESIYGIDGDCPVVENMPENISVVFNKAIDESTFTTDDITLTCQGNKIPTSQISISKKSDTEYNIDLSGVKADFGFYVLTIQTATILDKEGFTGSAGKSFSWILSSADGITEMKDLEWYVEVPVNHMLRLHGLKNIQRLTLTDITGKKRLEAENVDGDNGVRVSHIPDGVYILNIYTNGTILHRKIMKKVQ